MSRIRHKGGSPLPLRYFDAGYPTTTASAGADILGVRDNVVRPYIGGSKRKHSRRAKSRRGGFVPTIMEPFVAAAGKYIVPVALYSGYKLMTRGKTVKSGKSRKSGKKSKSRK